MGKDVAFQYQFGFFSDEGLGFGSKVPVFGNDSCWLLSALCLLPRVLGWGCWGLGAILGAPRWFCSLTGTDVGGSGGF